MVEELREGFLQGAELFALRLKRIAQEVEVGLHRIVRQAAHANPNGGVGGGVGGVVRVVCGLPLVRHIRGGAVRIIVEGLCAHPPILGCLTDGTKFRPFYTAATFRLPYIARHSRHVTAAQVRPTPATTSINC